MRTMTLLLAFVLITAASIGTWLVLRESAPSILLGPPDGRDDSDPWWLTVTVVEGPGLVPVANTPLTFLLRLPEYPEQAVPVERTTDPHGRVRIGPIFARLADKELELAAHSDRYEVAKGLVRAELVPSESRTLRATCEVVRISIVSGCVELPSGVPAEGVVVWRRIGPDFWVPVEIDDTGCFTHRGYGAEPVVLEAAAAWQGERWYGRARVDEGTRDVLVTLSDLRPGDPALLRVHVVGPDGAPATGLATLTFEGTGTLARSIGGQRISATGTVGFLYDPGATLKIEVKGIAPAGLGTGVVGAIGMDKTDVTVHLPRNPETAPPTDPGVDLRYFSDRPKRPSTPGSYGPELLVRVLDWSFEERGAWACIVQGRVIVRHTRLDAEGVARFNHLPDTEGLQIWISALGGNRYVWVKELEPGTTEIEVRPEVGSIVRGTVHFPGGVVPENWFVHAPGPAMSMMAESFAVGSFEVRQEGATFEVFGVPPGTWEFSLLHRTDGAGEWLYFEARAGEHVVVDVKAE